MRIAEMSDDGSSTEAPVVGRYSGKTIPSGDISLSGSQIYVEFTSDASIESDSFTAIVKCTPATCGEVAEFASWSELITSTCCVNDDACPNGYPTECTEECASLLFPMTEACDGFLSFSGMGPVRQTIDASLARCRGGDGH
eukprot:SAG31_NODE_5875_length_2279_cov_2.105046_1_plen_141_part_00